MSGFSINWLDLREAADWRARDDKLLKQARKWLTSSVALETDKTVVDFGAGTGSTLRAFADALNTDLQALCWRLLDQDPGLLAEARLRHGHSHRLETYELDLAKISALPLADAHLITASALFDLVSAVFVDTLVVALQSQQPPAGFYAALNYDGTTIWTPAHPLDDVVLEAFNRDQQRDKGFGVALGPGAGSYLEREFSAAGFKVFVAASPWVLNGADSKLVDALISGIADAVAQGSTIDTASLQDWIEFRKANIVIGTCIVGHTDLLALPDAD